MRFNKLISLAVCALSFGAIAQPATDVRTDGKETPDELPLRVLVADPNPKQLAYDVDESLMSDALRMADTTLERYVFNESYVPYLRRRPVFLDFSALKADHRDVDVIIKHGKKYEFDWCLGEKFNLTLFPGFEIVVENTQIKEIPPNPGQPDPGKYYYVGIVVGDPESEVLLVVNPLFGIITGSIETRGRFFQIDPIEGDHTYHVIWEVDTEIPRTGGDTIPPDAPREDTSVFSELSEELIEFLASSRDAFFPAANADLTGVPGVVDVGVFWTQNVAPVPNNNAIEDKIDLAWLKVQEAFSSAGVQMNLKLKQGVWLDQSGSPSDWWIANKIQNHYQLGYTGALRQQHALDLVIVIRSLPIGNDYGGARILDLDNEQRANTRYSGWSHEATLNSPGIYTLAHELGHLLGGHHQTSSDTSASCQEINADPNNGLFGQSHGEINPNSNDVTLLAATGNCNRLLAFSDPNTNFPGTPPTPTGDSTHNVRDTVLRTSHHVQQYRIEVPTCTPGIPIALNITPGFCLGENLINLTINGSCFTHFELWNMTLDMIIYAGGTTSQKITVPQTSTLAAKQCSGTQCSGLRFGDEDALYVPGCS